MRLLKELTEARGVSGFEQEVYDIMYRELELAGTKILKDRLGSLFGERQGTEDGPRILVAGHLDEVGFMVSEITADGYLRFTPIGGWWSQVLLAQRVSVMTDQQTYTGVIGSKAPHVLTSEELKRLYPMREMFIDVGAKSADQVKEWGIRVGDPIVPICPFEILPDGDTILAKALDNRMGCYMVVELLKQLQRVKHPNTVIAGATVQEEVGLRGATTSPYVTQPDIAFALDVGIAEDEPGGEQRGKICLGGGPLISFLDASMIPHRGLRNFVIDIAEKHQIPHQIEVMPRGGTDAGKFHVFQSGVPSIVIGVAARYIHSHVSMVSKKDIAQGVKLLVEVIQALDSKQVASL